MAVRVKICGITSVSDARAAVRCGADALGFVFAASRRRITPERARAIVAALPPFVTPVALFVDAEPKYISEVCEYCRISTVQLHGNETPATAGKLHDYKVIKAFRIRKKSDIDQLERYASCDAYLLDTYVEGKMGGTGKTFNWNWARGARSFGPIILAGGLTPDNVAEAIKVAKPYAVDVSSGVEIAPGQKSRELMQGFMEAVRGAL